jgi:photosystem II stability/assembly factor-like uncharacterized protein
MGMRKLLICSVFVLLCAFPAAADWRRAGLFGADVRALIVDPAAPDTLYVGTSGGEIYSSQDAGGSWVNPRGAVPFPGYIVDNLTIDSRGRLWAACWGLWGGGVVAVSGDGGKSWTRRDAGLEEFSVRSIAIDPNNADFVVVGGLTGVYRSTDSGQSWTKISDQENVESLAIDPRTADRIYVGTWRQGIRTEDGGKSWKLINSGMVLDTDMFSITIDPKNPDNVWVSTCGWVYNSKDRGDNWTRYRDGFNNRRIHDIEIDPLQKDSVFAGSVAGLYRTADGGKSWTLATDESLVINSIVLHPKRPNRVILGIEGDGVYVSNDGAKTFTRRSDGLRNVQITTIAADPLVKNRVYAAVVFGGASSGIYRSDDAGARWSRLSTTKLPEVLSLDVTESPEVKFIAGTEKGFFWSADGVQWTQSEPLAVPVRVEKVLRFNAQRMFAATSEGVFTTRDAGKSWYRLASADSRAVDIAIGALGDKKALFALSANGLTVFDGQRWAAIADAPAKGRTIAVRQINGAQYVFIAGAQGVKAARVDIDKTWHAAAAPNAQYASVFGAARNHEQLLFLTSRQQRNILIGDPADEEWRSMVLPSRNTEVTTIAPDQLDHDRFYVGTLSEGVFIFEGKIEKWVAATPAEDAAGAHLAGAGSK